MTISLYGYFIASPTPYLALDQETDTRNHTHFEIQEKCVCLCRRNVYEFENFLTYVVNREFLNVRKEKQ